jgi:hypothetical protein
VIKSKGEVHWKVVSAEPRPKSLLEVDLLQAELQNGEKLFRSEKISIRGESSELDLLNPFADIWLKISTKTGTMGPVDDLYRFFAKKKRGSETPIWSGPGKFEFFADFRPGSDRLKGSFKWSNRGFSVSHNRRKTILTGDLEGAISLSSDHYSSGKFKVGKTSVSLKSPVIKNEGKKDSVNTNWDLSVAFENGQVTFADSILANGKLRLKVSDIKVPVSYIVPDNFWVDIGVFLFPMYSLEGAGDFKVNRAGFFLTDFEADSKSGSIKAGVAKLNGEKMEISLLVDLFPVDLCVRTIEGEDIQVTAKSADKRCQATDDVIKYKAAKKPPSKRVRSMQ